MRILGIHDGHNASACLLEDGKIKYVLQEERLTRVKDAFGFPSLAIKEIFKSAKISYKDLDFVAFSFKYLSKISMNKEELLETYRKVNSCKTYIRRVLKRTFVKSLYGKWVRQKRIKEITKEGFPKERAIFIDHHLSHAFAAYYGTPWWKNEKVLVLTNDAGGDNLCATVNIGENGQLKRIAQVKVANSLGYIYSMITFILGMVPEEHEYKLMGMAPYCHNNGAQKSYINFKRLLKFDLNNGGITWHRANGCPHTQYSYKFFRKLTELHRFDWICAGLQRFCEEMLVEWVKNCIRKTRIRKVALSGGVFLNVKANKLIAELPELESLFIFPSCGDESTSIGAVYQVYAEEKLKRGETINIDPLKNIYFGLEFKDGEIEEILNNGGYKYEKKDDIEKEVAHLLTQGNVVARFKGRMEFGARALGNRSILADPIDTCVVKTINDMIKNRDFWMPFAPSILKERSDEYLMNHKQTNAPYMIICFDSTEKVKELRAACHPYDNTIRPQVVDKGWNPDYYRLMKEFEKLTGRGAILNTSFNLHGHPMVCSPKDALEVFMKSGLEYMALGNFLVRK